MQLSLQDLLCCLQKDIIVTNARDFDTESRFPFVLSSDTRTIQKGCSYIALVGMNFNGNSFISEAVNRGASLVIASEGGPLPGIPTFIVQNTRKALALIATKIRMMLTKTRFFGITGSVGKTTTKDMLKIFMGAYGHTGGTEFNFNNDIGLPKAIIALEENVKYAVLEMGMNHFHEIEYLTNIARPNIAIITNIDVNHLQNFGSVREIALAKSEIFLGMNSSCAVILNRDHGMYSLLVHKARCRGLNHIITYGKHHKAHIRLVAQEHTRYGIRMQVQILGQKPLEYSVGKIGSAVAINSLASIAVAVAEGLDPILGCQELINFSLPAGKGEAMSINLTGGRSITLVDESYNSGPAALAANLEKLLTLQGKRILLILGDMLELGSQTEASHAKFAQQLNNLGTFISIGPYMSAINKNGCAFDSVDALLPELDKLIKNGDVILVKGSMAWRMHKVVAFIKALAN